MAVTRETGDCRTRHGNVDQPQTEQRKDPGFGIPASGGIYVRLSADEL
jgi:hypothetical protein